MAKPIYVRINHPVFPFLAPYPCPALRRPLSCPAMSTAASKSPQAEPAPEHEFALPEQKVGGMEAHPPRSMLKNLIRHARDDFERELAFGHPAGPFARPRHTDVF